MCLFFIDIVMKKMYHGLTVTEIPSYFDIVTSQAQTTNHKPKAKGWMYNL